MRKKEIELADFYINTEKAMNASQDIISTAVRLNKLKNELEDVKLGRVLSGQSGVYVEQAIKKLVEKVSGEAVKMDSLGDALQMIAEKYREAEKKAIENIPIIDASFDTISNTGKPTTPGSDKRNLWNKFWDWVTNQKPDEYDTTSIEQEKAADEAMKKKMWNVLQDEKYSQENWDNASVEERKQILQDYMNEVIKIYGLQDVKPTIVWDSNATYTAQSITWGYYNHGRHTVTLNAQALTDSVGNWDSYDLLETVSHELRHAYQNEAVDHPTKYMVSKETIDTWKKNFKNYISSDKGYEKYRNQPVEVDAREFQVRRDDT